MVAKLRRKLFKENPKYTKWFETNRKEFAYFLADGVLFSVVFGEEWLPIELWYIKSGWINPVICHLQRQLCWKNYKAMSITLLKVEIQDFHLQTNIIQEIFQMIIINTKQTEGKQDFGFGNWSNPRESIIQWVFFSSRFSKGNCTRSQLVVNQLSFTYVMSVCGLPADYISRMHST